MERCVCVCVCGGVTKKEGGIKGKLFPDELETHSGAAMHCKTRIKIEQSVTEKSYCMYVHLLDGRKDEFSTQWR